MRQTQMEAGHSPSLRKYPFTPRVAPLSIHKVHADDQEPSTASSPEKIKTKSTALQEVPPVSGRRNSPSHVLMKDQIADYKSGMPKSESTSSMRSYWLARENEKGAVVDKASSPGRDADILDSIKKKSRVKNNSLLAKDREGEPSPPSKIPRSNSRKSVDNDDGIGSNNASPGPSLLVSRRLYGPREVVSTPDAEDVTTGDNRRKTVTFDEDLKVLTFQRQVSESQSMNSQRTGSMVSDTEEDGSCTKEEQNARPLPQIPTATTESLPDEHRNISLLSRLEASVKDLVLHKDDSALADLDLHDANDIYKLYGIRSPLLSNTAKSPNPADVTVESTVPQLPEIFASFGLDEDERRVLARYLETNHSQGAVSSNERPFTPIEQVEQAEDVVAPSSPHHHHIALHTDVTKPSLPPSPSKSSELEVYTVGGTTIGPPRLQAVDEDTEFTLSAPSPIDVSFGDLNAAFDRVIEYQKVCVLVIVLLSHLI